MYELSNHLGNVLTTVSDIKLTADGNADGVVDSYAAVITSAQDYYPFGSLETDRTYSSDNYRFGFNGQEMDNEITGQTGTHTTAMFWEYDARLGRRWNVDPVVKENESPYLCFSGNPILFSDPAGNDAGRRLDRWEIDMITGQIRWISPEGGSTYQYITMVTNGQKTTRCFETQAFNYSISPNHNQVTFSFPVKGASSDVMNSFTYKAGYHNFMSTLDASQRSHLEKLYALSNVKQDNLSEIYKLRNASTEEKQKWLESNFGPKDMATIYIEQKYPNSNAVLLHSAITKGLGVLEGAEAMGEGDYFSGGVTVLRTFVTKLDVPLTILEGLNYFYQNQDVRNRASIGLWSDYNQAVRDKDWNRAEHIANTIKTLQNE